MTTPIQDHKKSGVGVVILRILAIAAVIGITVYIYSIRDHVEEFAVYGYPGIFLVALLANATSFCLHRVLRLSLQWEVFSIRLAWLWPQGQAAQLANSPAISQALADRLL